LLLRWGQNKRMRCRRDCASASPQRRQAGGKIPRRSSSPAADNLMPPPSAAPYARGSNLRYATPRPPRSGASDAHHGRGALPNPLRYGCRLYSHAHLSGSSSISRASSTSFSCRFSSSAFTPPPSRGRTWWRGAARRRANYSGRVHPTVHLACPQIFFLWASAAAAAFVAVAGAQLLLSAPHPSVHLIIPWSLLPNRSSAAAGLTHHRAGPADRGRGH
jgi:hypothetical protein